MKIRTKIVSLFAILFMIMFSIFSSILYLSSKNSREVEFYNLLKREAVTKASLFLKSAVDSVVLHEIYSHNSEIIDEVQVAIYDHDFSLIYHDSYEIDFVKESEDMLQSIVDKGELFFYVDSWQVVGLKYSLFGNDYIITAAAYDGYGYSKLNNLFNSIVYLLSFSIVVVILLGLFFSYKILYPLRSILGRIKKISAINLNMRLPVSGNDEMSILSKEFNKMLDRLEESFESQKSFLANISHELRTPLTSLIIELELLIYKDVDKCDPQLKSINSALSDAKRMVRLFNSILDLSKASYDKSNIVFKSLRVDDVVFEAKESLESLNSEYNIDIIYEGSNLDSGDDSWLIVYANDYLLKIAFLNLIENACKYSLDNRCVITIGLLGNKLSIRFLDNGEGFETSDLEKVFTPFYRGSNSEGKDGFGIGLALVKKIATLHDANIYIDKNCDSGGSIVTIIF